MVGIISIELFGSGKFSGLGFPLCGNFFLCLIFDIIIIIRIVELCLLYYMIKKFLELIFHLNMLIQSSFAAHFEQQFNATTSCTDLRKYMAFKVIKQLKPIGTMKTFTKPNFNLCMEERWTILKSYVTNVSRLWIELGDIWGLSAQNKFSLIFLSTDDPIFIWWKG